GKRPALRHEVDPENAVAAVAADAGDELADRPEADYEQGAARGDVGVFDALPRGGQDVAEVQVAFVGQVAVDLHGVEVGERNPKPLGLTAGHLAVQLGVAVETRAGTVLA